MRRARRDPVPSRYRCGGVTEFLLSCRSTTATVLSRHETRHSPHDVDDTPRHDRAPTRQHSPAALGFLAAHAPRKSKVESLFITASLQPHTRAAVSSSPSPPAASSDSQRTRETIPSAVSPPRVARCYRPVPVSRGVPVSAVPVPVPVPPAPPQGTTTTTKPKCKDTPQT